MDKCYVDLLEYLPNYWHEYLEMVILQNVLGEEIGHQECSMLDYFQNVFVESAENKGLTVFEKVYGIVSEEKLSDELRREVIIAKMRGAGTTTVELIKKVAESFSGGEVDVIEKNDKYIVSIKFVGVKGIPENMNGLKKALREIIPAHLDIEYIFTYLTWQEFDDYNKTWQGWDDLNLTWHKLERYKEV